MISGIVRVVSGNAVSQLVLIASSLVIARAVLPEEYGGFASLTAVTAVLGVLVSLRLELAIPRPKSAAESYGVLKLTLTASVVISVVLGFVLGGTLLLGDTLGWWRGIGWLTPATLGLATVSTALIGIFSGLNQMALRAGLYSLLARRVALQALATALAQISLTWVFPTTESLLVGQIFGQLVGLLLLKGLLTGRPAEYPRSLREVLLEYRAFAFVAAPSAVINALGLQAPLLLGAAVWGASFAGWFGFTQRVMAAPVALIGAAIGQVFTGEFGRALREDDPRVVGKFRRASLLLLLLGGCIGFVFFLAGPALFAWLLGDTYRTSGEYARSLSLGIVAQMMAAPLSVVLPLLGRQGWQAAWDLVRLAVVVVVLLSSSLFSLPPEGALWFLGAANLVLYLLLWWVAHRAVAVRFSRGQGLGDLPAPETSGPADRTEA